MAEERKNWELKWELLVADAWADPKLKERLLTNTAEVLKERGVEPPSGKTIRVVEETADTSYFVLPAKPAEAEISEEELRSVAGGWCGGCRCREGCRGCREGCRGCGRPCRG
jgi:hypothetical protein